MIIADGGTGGGKKKPGYQAPIWDNERVGKEAPTGFVTTPVTTGTRKPSGASSGASGGGSSTGSSGGSKGGSSYAQPQPDPYEAYRRALEELEARQRAAREQAYQAAARQQKNDLAYSTGQVNTAADRALQEAYINRMMTLRNLPQTMAAQGLTGGAAESTMAGLYNSYSDARNELEAERLAQISALQQAYNNNMAQLEIERATGEQAALSDLTPYLLKLAAGTLSL